jgi:hypothetical protein
MIAVNENVSQVKLPPSERDFEMYRSVMFHNQSTRAAAANYGISQTRVRQVLMRVVEFLCLAVPESLPKTTKEKRLYAAEQIGRMQLEHLYGEAIQMWRKSQEVRSLTSASLGQVSFLNQAMKISVALSRVPVHPLPEFREEEGVGNQESGVEGKEFAQGDAQSVLRDLLARMQQSGRNGTSPPDRACSKSSAEQVTAESAAVKNPAATSASAPVSDEPAASDADATRPTCDPAQSVTEPAESGESPAVPQRLRDRKLNRRERRARERLLQKALARKKPR